MEEVDGKPLEVLIVGGSLSGLMAGILLKRKGHNVRILEKADSSERSGLAAGVGLPQHVKAFFEKEDRLKHIPIGVLNEGFTIIDAQLNDVLKMSISTYLTTWDAAYYRLRANFDGVQSTYSPHPPPSDPDGTEGEGVYLTGKKVIKIYAGSQGVHLDVEDTKTGATETYQGDIAIAADGANSPIRRQLHPQLKREEPGYVIWRGTIPTKDLSRDVLSKIENRPLICPGSQNYCIVYTIPGENGSLAPGETHINFAWYFWPQDTSLKDIMTDAEGHHHRSTIPKGKMRSDIWQRQVEFGRKNLPPTFFALVERIQQPFVSVISSISTPKAAYFNHHLFFVGDALAQVQPNIGMGTNMAALAIMTLVDEVICPPKGTTPLAASAVEQWEYKILQETQLIRLRSAAFASWYLNSWPMIGYYYARYYAALYWQYYFGKRSKKFTVFNNKP